MGKNCVQAVRSTGRNYGDRFPLLPHSPACSDTSASGLCTNRGSFTALVRAERTEMYTRKKGHITVLKNYLSPVSTEPTITTTTYI